MIYNITHSSSHESRCHNEDSYDASWEHSRTTSVRNNDDACVSTSIARCGNILGYISFMCLAIRVPTI